MVHAGSLFEPAPPAGPGRRGAKSRRAQNVSKIYTKPFVFAYEIESGILATLDRISRLRVLLCSYWFLDHFECHVDHFLKILWGSQRIFKK